MKPIIALSLAALAAAGLSGPLTSRERLSDEQKLATAIGDRVAGAPVDCIRTRELGGNVPAGDGAIVFRGRSNSILYVNRPPGGCPDLSRDRAIRVHTITTQLCKGDIVNVFDPLYGIEYGGCGLGEFTPYRRASSRSRL